MTFVSVTNILLALLSVVVVVQSIRMTRSVRAIRNSDLGEAVKLLERATGQARDVLLELKRLLSSDANASVRALSSAEELRDELSLMVGIANGVADRLMEAAEATKAKPAAEAKTTRARPKRVRGSRGRGQSANVEKVEEIVAAEKKAAPRPRAVPKEAVLAAVPEQQGASVTRLPLKAA